MKNLYLASAALALTIAATPAMSQNLVTNGSFESGFSGFTLGNTGGGTAPVVIRYNQTSGYPTGAFGEAIPTDTATSLSPDAVGNFVAYFSSDTANPDSLTQAVNLTSGIIYNVGFDYYVPQNGYNNPFDATLSFLVNGVAVGSALTTGSPTSSTTPGVWRTFNTSFTATSSGSQTLTFQFRGLGTTAADFAIDRVYAVAAVPEPASWALMIGGFGMVGAGLRRRRAKTTVRFA
jgi:hypothetical protein